MTSAEMMRKIGLQKEEVLNGKKANEIKKLVFKHLKDGKKKLLVLEGRIKNDKSYKKLQDGIKRSKVKFQEAKVAFNKYETQAEQYIEKNPKKAVAMAAAAGVLAGTLWSAFKSPRPVGKKKK